MRDGEPEWKPIGVDALEHDADEAVRSKQSMLVIAGPGAGKTELLAQRAAYLLQAGVCSDPQRILALSFKRDAARNLSERVARRVGPKLAMRFDSFTFDAFGKGLVDRFREALPDEWRPSSDFDIDFRITTNTRDAVLAIPDRLLPLDRWRREALPHAKGDFFRRCVVGAQLPLPPTSHSDDDRTIAGRALWMHLLQSDPSLVAFPMLTRLAQLVLKENPSVRAALQATFAYVFLDEFQDTTAPQYSLIATVFRGSSSVLTAVGDPKQCVMRWTGADPRLFPAFVGHFNATERTLKHNHRSARALVDVQAVVARRIDSKATRAEAVGSGATDAAECIVLEYDDHEAEAADLAERVEGWIQNDGLSPRDVCILTRQNPALYAGELINALAALGRRARVEQELQDLLIEPFTIACLDLFHLAVEVRAPKSWVRSVELMVRLNPSLRGGDRAADSVAATVEAIRAAIADGASIERLVDEMMSVFGEARLRAAEPAYRRGSWLADLKRKFTMALAEAKEGRSWREALDELEGVGAIPVLTAHKSKGLEYHTVIFIGLEDSAHFGMIDSPEEETSVFFVALSRAKRRVVATFADRRPTKRGFERQTRQNIRSFYEALAEAGVQPVRVATK